MKPFELLKQQGRLYVYTSKAHSLPRRGTFLPGPKGANLKSEPKTLASSIVNISALNMGRARPSRPVIAHAVTIAIVPVGMEFQPMWTLQFASWAHERSGPGGFHYRSKLWKVRCVRIRDQLRSLENIVYFNLCFGLDVWV